MNPIVSNGNKLRWTFENVKNLNEEGLYSDTISIKNIDWKIKIAKISLNGAHFLSVYLIYDSDNKNKKNWICETDTKYKLVSQKKHIDSGYKNCYSELSTSWGSTLSKWIELVNEDEFKKNNSIVIDVDVSFKYYDFSKTIANFTDVTVIVENTEFHLNKWVLSSKSEYFYDLFVVKKSEVKEYHMNEITTSELRYLLATFNPFFNTIRERNYKELMDVANRFGVPSLHQKCEQFLISHTDMQLIEKVKYADENDYEELMKTCIESLESGTDIRNLQACSKFAELKESTKLRIMYRFLDFF